MAKSLGAAKVSYADYYRLSWQILIVVSAALMLVSGIGRTGVVLGLVLINYLLLSSVVQSVKIQSRLLTMLIGAATLALAVVDITQMHDLASGIGGMLEIIAATIPILLVHKDRHQSYWLTILAVIVLGMGCISVAASPAVYVLFALLTISLMFSLNAAELYFASSPEPAHSNLQLPRAYLRQLLLVMPAGLTASVLIFFGFPRAQVLSFGSMGGTSGRVTGYSGVVRLSSDGELNPSDQVVMRLEADSTAWLSAAAATLLIRGDTLERFDGMSWYPAESTYAPLEKGQDLRVAKQSPPHGIHREVTIHMEPSPQPTLFYPDVLQAVLSRKPSSVPFSVNRNGTLVRSSSKALRFSYTVLTGPYPEPKAEQSIRSAYQSMPEQIASKPQLTQVPEQIAQAAYYRDWLTQLHLADSMTVSEVEARLLQIFTSQFHATLKASGSGHLGFEDFLSHSKQGHCEYFATVAALTLRSLHVPTRLVVGYQGGVYNDFVQALEVQDEDAHAWVEVYVPPYGWLAFNPTPPVPRMAGTSLFRSLRLMRSAAEFWIRKYVSFYDQDTQKELLQSLNLKDQQTVSWKEQLSRARKLGFLIPYAVLGILLLILLRRWRRRRLQKRRYPGIPSYYLRFLVHMERFQIPPFKHENLIDYHLRLTNHHGVPAGFLDSLERAILKDLYGRPTDDLFSVPESFFRDLNIHLKKLRHSS